MELLTPRMRLRPVAPDDLDLVTTLLAEPEAVPFLGEPDPPAQTLARWLDETGHWLAFARNADAFIGGFVLRPKNGGERELGYRLRHDWWGRGLATEGARALIAYAFDELEARRVWAQTLASHAASRRVMERAGLRHTGEPKNGEVEYAAGPAEWVQNPA